jgi:type I restriction enzyme S subunit
VSSACLGQVAEFINGAAFKPSDWHETGRRIIRIQNLTDADKPFNRTNRVISSKYEVPPGTLLVSWSASLGVFEWLEDDTALLNQHIFKVVPNRRIIRQDYLRNMLVGALSDMAKFAHGSTMLHVNRGEFLATRIPLPPLDEQRHVAAILDQTEALRCDRRKSLKCLADLARSTFHEMFGDPLRNPKGWNDGVQLGQVADIASGVAKGRRLNLSNARVVPYLAVANVQDRFLALDNVKTIEATEDEIVRYRLRRDDLLLTEGGDPDKLGRGALWTEEIEEVIHQNHIFRVRLIVDDIHPLFLNWLIGSERGKHYFLRAAKQTTGIASINMGQLRQFPLFVPPLGLQVEFAAELARIEQQTTLSNTHLDGLDTLFRSLQHRAFLGNFALPSPGELELA